MAKIIEFNLKQKLQTTTDYTNEPFTSEEALELDIIINDPDSDVDDKILCAKIMLNIAENRLKRATNQVVHFKGIYLGLVHAKEFGKHTDSTVKMLEKLGNTDELIKLMQALLDKKEDSR